MHTRISQPESKIIWEGVEPKRMQGKGLEHPDLLTKESRPFFLGDKSLWSFPLFLLFAFTACGGPEDYFSLAIFWACEFTVPNTSIA